MDREALIRFVKLALKVAEAELPRYSHRNSRHWYRLAQLSACCCLKVLLRQDWRGIEAVLCVSGELRQALGLQRVPDHSTLCRFSKRWMTGQRLDRMLGRVCELAGVEQGAVAVDSTGFETGSASVYFAMRRGGRRRGYVKLSLLVALGGLLAVGAESSIGPRNDKLELRALLPRLAQRMQASQLLADAGYDAEWVHEWCRDHHDIESWIAPVVHRRDGTVRGRWRAVMAQGLPEHFGRRWGVESFISGLKRTVGSKLHARRRSAQLAEAVLHCLVYSLRRWRANPTLVPHSTTP